jgi:hypothetical protein
MYSDQDCSKMRANVTLAALEVLIHRVSITTNQEISDCVERAQTIGQLIDTKFKGYKEDNLKKAEVAQIARIHFPRMEPDRTSISNLYEERHERLEKYIPSLVRSLLPTYVKSGELYEADAFINAVFFSAECLDNKIYPKALDPS